jgi:hypothetical protein
MNLNACAAVITDPRSSLNQKYSLESLIFMITVSVLCDSCEDPEDIRDFVSLKLDWFKQFVLFRSLLFL